MFLKIASLIGLALALDAVKEKVAVGIDLGTTFCCVCVYKPSTNETSFIEYGTNGITYPSVAYYKRIYDNESKKEKGIFITGWEASTHNLSNSVPGSYFYGFKRAMGVAKPEEISRVERFEKNVTYKVVKDYSDNKVKTVFVVVDENNNEVENTSAEQLSTIILRELKEQVEKYYEIESLVITVPAYFTTFQIEATMSSAASAGLPLPEMNKEPVAAAYAYQVNKFKNNLSKDEYIFVFDLGGGTFDASVVEIMEDVIMVAKYGGDNYLGGENVNDKLTEYFANVVKQKNGYDVMANQKSKLRLRRFVEDFKIKLCNKVNASDVKTGIVHKDDYNYQELDVVELELSIEKFDELNREFYGRISEVLEDPNYGMFRKSQGKGSDEPFDRSKISKILLVGGSTRIPYIKRMLQQNFPKSEIHDEINADTIVAEGACLLAANKAKMLPDTMAIQLVDVVPLPVGICTDEDYFEPILEKDTYIPGSGTKEFTTSHDGQTKVRIQVSQGYRASFKANHYLGTCELDIPPGQPRGVPRISVTIKMTSDGTIDVSAKDVNTNKDTKVVFDSIVTRLDKQKYQQLYEDAQKNAEADRELKEKFTSQRLFEEEIELTKRRISQPGISEDDKINVEALINGSRKWIESNKTTASKADYDDKLASFKEAVGAVLDKKVEAEVPPQPEEQKDVGREEL